MISAAEALEKLIEGNKRFASDRPTSKPGTDAFRRSQIADGQNPFAIILGCADSRVPAEIVFDQGLGDLFVIRVAGNVVAPTQVGSVEFAASAFGAPLVVVLGHTNCGAISATIDELSKEASVQSPNLRSIVNFIRPSVETLLETEIKNDRDTLIKHCVRANIRASAHHLRYGSEILQTLIKEKGLLVVGAEYSLETGEVDFFDGISDILDME